MQIALGVLVGAIAGVGIAALTSGPDLPDVQASSPPARTTQATRTTPTTPSTTTPARPTLPTLRSGSLTAAITGVELVPATSDSGQSRDRARVVVDVEVRNDGQEALTPADVFRLWSDDTFSPDPASQGEPGVLDTATPLPPGESRSGELRFELAGAATTRATNTGEVRLVLQVPGQERAVASLDVGTTAGG